MMCSVIGVFDFVGGWHLSPHGKNFLLSWPWLLTALAEVPSLYCVSLFWCCCCCRCCCYLFCCYRCWVPVVTSPYHWGVVSSQELSSFRNDDIFCGVFLLQDLLMSGSASACVIGSWPAASVWRWCNVEGLDGAPVRITLPTIFRWWLLLFGIFGFPSFGICSPCTMSLQDFKSNNPSLVARMLCWGGSIWPFTLSAFLKMALWRYRRRNIITFLAMLIGW